MSTHMTQEQALAEAQALFPEDAKYIHVERQRLLRPSGARNDFYIWNHAKDRTSCIVAHSERSWEQALAIAKSGNEDIWPEDDSPVEEVLKGGE